MWISTATDTEDYANGIHFGATRDAKIARVSVDTLGVETHLRAEGHVSADTFRFAVQTSSPDTSATHTGPALYVHSDGSLRFYDGSGWSKVTLE